MKNTIQNDYNSLSKSSFLRFTVFSKITFKNSSNSLSKLVLFQRCEIMVKPLKRAYNSY